MISIFKALSDETRLRILSLIINDEMCVCEIEKSLGLTQSNASRHLTTLKDAGILLSFKHAQWTYYKLNEEFVKNNNELFDYLKTNFNAIKSFQTDIQKMKEIKQNTLC